MKNRHTPRQRTRQNILGLILSGLLLACFFAPWSKFFALPGSGFALALSPKIEGGALFIFPVLCLIVMVTSLLRWNNRWLQVLTGLTPILAVTGGLVYAARDMEVSLGDLLPTIRPFIAWGVYVTLIIGCLLLLNGLFSGRRVE